MFYLELQNSFKHNLFSCPTLTQISFVIFAKPKKKNSNGKEVKRGKKKIANCIPYLIKHPNVYTT